MQSNSVNKSLIKKNAYGNDKNLDKHGNKQGYLYSVGDGFNLLLSIRQNILQYIQVDGVIFNLKAPGEEYSATRENNQRAFLTDPYYIDNFAESLEDDIKTITGQHNVDQHGVDQRAKNNLWTVMPKFIVIPLLSDGHWRSIRVEVDYDNQQTNILYSDPYGGDSFYQALIDKVKPAIIQAVNTLISHHSAQPFVLPKDSIEEHHKQIDQQGKERNAWDCGPITFRNIADYANTNLQNIDFASDEEEQHYTVSLATNPVHAKQIREVRVADIETYRAVTGIELPQASIDRIQQTQIAIKKGSEVYKAKIQGKTEEIYTKIHALPDELVQLMFSMVGDHYTEQELAQVYNFVTEAAETALDTPDFVSSELGLWLSKTYDGKLIADGLKNTLHGNIFQLGLLTLAAIRAQEVGKGFYLITEAREFEKFDDLGIDYGDRITFLQAKHSAGEGVFSKADFMHEDDDASLAKYFDSWAKLRQGEFVKLPDGELKKTKFVFFSNKKLKDMDDYIEEVKIEDDEFAFPNFKTTPSYRIIKGEKREDFIKAIVLHSKTIILEELAIEDLELDKFKQEIIKATIIVTQKLPKTNNKTKLNGNNVGKRKGEEAIDKNVVLAVIKLASEDRGFAERLAVYTENDIWKRAYEKFEIISIKDALEPLRKIQAFDSVDTEPINQFLDEFIIKTSQPNVAQLFDIIKQEIGAQINIGAQESYTGIVHSMLEWFRERHACILTSDQFNQWNIAQQADLNRFYFLRFTQAFEDEFIDYPLDLQELINQKLLEFLSSPREVEQRFQIIKGDAVKPIVYHTIQHLKDLKDGEWVYIEYSDKLVQDVTAIFQGGSTKFLVVNCHNIEESSEQQVYNIANLIQNQGNVKIVLLTRSDVMIPQSLLELRPQENLLEALSDAQIQAVCNPHQNRYITLAGKEYKIQDIIDHKLGNTYELMKNIQYLAQIIEHAHEKQILAESEMPYGVYIPNQMMRGEGYYDLSIIARKNAQYYIIEGIEYNQLLDELRGLFKDNPERFAEVQNVEVDAAKLQVADFILLNNPNLIIENDEQKISILIEKPLNLDQKKYIVLRPVEGFTTERLKVVENLSNLYLPFAGGVDFSYQARQEEFLNTISTSGQLSVLISPAGYGKTSFCRNIVEQHHKLPHDISLPIWSIKILLPKLQFDSQNQPHLAPFVNIHYPWEYQAFQQDMHVKGRVLIVLDSFDEVKDAKALVLINNWIQTIPREVSLLITTRPYAANKLLLPSGQNVLFYKLTEYTEEQRKDYFTQYIKAILEKIKIKEDVFNVFVERIIDNVATRLNEHSSKILGIPLESYIFCELLKPHILTYIASNGNKLPVDADISLENLDISNTAKLYQEFILSKSMLFLEKHLGIKPENISKKGIIFNLMGAYNQVMELYALKQAFSISDITEYIKNINFDIGELTTLEDTGLLKVSEDGTRLNFSHETYQEFYAALAIIRGLLSNRGDLFDLTKELVEQNRYDPKFHFIFSIAAQFSLVAGPMIPGYNAEQHLLLFWEALGDNGDIIGAGAVRMLKYCLAEFMEEQVAMLLSRVEGKPWARFIKVTLSQRDKLAEDPAQEVDGEELPITINDIDEENGDEQDIHNINTHKNFIAKEFRLLRKKNAIDQEKVGLLEKVAQEHSDGGDYWALDGGIEAIGYTGEFFSKALADYLVSRTGLWENNKVAVISALGTIYRSLEGGDCIAKQNCFYVTQTLISPISAGSVSQMHNLLYQVDIEFIKYLTSNLRLQIQSLNIKDFSIGNPGAIFEEPLKIIKSILSVARKLQYAVVVEANHIVLVKDSKIPINFGLGVLNSIFANEMLSMLAKMRDADNKDLDTIFSSHDLDESSQSAIEHYFLQQLENDQIFDLLFNKKWKFKDSVGNLFKLLFEYKLLNKHKVEKLVAVCQNPPGTKLFWDNDGGIKAIGYTGQFFNVQLADHLRAVRDWSNNIKQALEALKQIHSTLTNEDIIDNDNYDTAVQAYNQCIQNYRFNTLESIVVEDEDIGGEGLALNLDVQYQEYCPIALFYNRYYKYGLDEMLLLRLKDANLQDIAVLPVFKLNIHTLQTTLPEITKKLDEGFDKVIVPGNIEGKHWVGFLFQKTVDSLKVLYLDSEHGKLAVSFKNQFIEYFQGEYQEVQIIEEAVERQKYNNCGPEVIENFMYYLTGSRTTQEAAVYLHSLLLENTLLDPEIYKLKIEDNNKLIKFLSNSGPMPMQYTPIVYEERLITIMNEINQSFRLANSDSSSKMIMEETYDSIQFQGRVVVGALSERIIKLGQEQDDRVIAKIMQEGEYHRVETDGIIQQISDKSSVLVQPNYESNQESDSQFILIGEQVKVGIPGNNRQEHSAVALIAGGVEEGIVLITTLAIIDTNGHYRSDNTGVSPKSGFIGYLANLAEEFVTSVSSRAMSIGNTMTNGIMKNEYIKGKILNYVYYEEVVGVNSVISKEYVQGSTNSGVQEVLKKHPFTWDKKDFKKLKLVVHPDKGGNAEDFRAINEFEDQIGKTEHIYENIYNKLAEKLQPKIQKVSIYTKGADVGIDLAKVYLKPNVENVLNTIYDGIVLCNKVPPNVLGASVVMVTTPITSLYHLYQGDYEKAGIQGINGLSYYMLNSKYLPGYGLYAYAGLNGITIVYDVYKGEYLEAGLQTVGIAGMVFAPTLTGAYYAIRYTYNNAHGLYQLYQSKQQENILGFNNIIARLLVKTINDNIHDEVIQNILRSISLDQRLEEAGVKEEVVIISNEYDEREGIDLISLEDIAEYLKDKNKVVIRQINNLDATKLIKEKVDKLINKGGVLNYLKEYVGYASVEISETKRVEASESIKLEIMQLLGKKDVNYDEVEVIIKNAIDIIKSKYLPSLYNSIINNEVLKILKEIEEEVLVAKDKDGGRDKGSKEYYTEEVSRVIVGKDGEGITIIEVSPYKQLTSQTSEEQLYCNRMSKENEENKIYESIKCIRKDLDIADITNNKLHLPMMMGLDEAVADILIDSKNNNSKDNNKDVLYYWNKEHKTKLEKALINLSNNEELINIITKEIEESKSWIIPQSVKQEIITEEYIKEKTEKELGIVGSVMNYGKSFFVSDNRSLNDRLEEYLVSKVTDKSKESDVATMIKIMSVNKEGCYMHGYILDSYAEIIDHETVKSNNSELCNNEISNYINKGDIDA